MSSETNALRKKARPGDQPGSAGKAPSKTHVGHGGVIDLHAYAAPSDLRPTHMEKYLGYLVRSLGNRIDASFLDSLGGEDITPARFTALSIIAVYPGVRQVDIARFLDIARPAALKVVNRLVELGLIEIHPIPSDKRIGALALTAKGEARLAQYERAVRAHEDRIFGRLTEAERATFRALTRKLLDI